MIITRCDLCKHKDVPIFKPPCLCCLGKAGSPCFEAKEPNYGSCRDSHLTTNGDCDVYRDATPCLQWDCGSWSNEPDKAKSDDNMDRLKWLMLEFIRLMDKYAADPNEKRRAVWHNDIAPALLDRIEARARAMYREQFKAQG